MINSRQKKLRPAQITANMNDSELYNTLLSLIKQELVKESRENLKVSQNISNTDSSIQISTESQEFDLEQIVVNLINSLGNARGSTLALITYFLQSKDSNNLILTVNHFRKQFSSAKREKCCTNGLVFLWGLGSRGTRQISEKQIVFAPPTVGREVLNHFSLYIVDQIQKSNIRAILVSILYDNTIFDETLLSQLEDLLPDSKWNLERELLIFSLSMRKNLFGSKEKHAENCEKIVADEQNKHEKESMILNLIDILILLPNLSVMERESILRIIISSGFEKITEQSDKKISFKRESREEKVVEIKNLPKLHSEEQTAWSKTQNGTQKTQDEAIKSNPFDNSDELQTKERNLILNPPLKKFLIASLRSTIFSECFFAAKILIKSSVFRGLISNELSWFVEQKSSCCDMFESIAEPKLGENLFEPSKLETRARSSKNNCANTSCLQAQYALEFISKFNLPVNIHIFSSDCSDLRKLKIKSLVAETITQFDKSNKLIFGLVEKDCVGELKRCMKLDGWVVIDEILKFATNSNNDIGEISAVNDLINQLISHTLEQNYEVSKIVKIVAVHLSKHTEKKSALHLNSSILKIIIKSVKCSDLSHAIRIVRFYECFSVYQTLKDRIESMQATGHDTRHNKIYSACKTQACVKDLTLYNEFLLFISENLKNNHKIEWFRGYWPEEMKNRVEIVKKFGKNKNLIQPGNNNAVNPSNNKISNKEMNAEEKIVGKSQTKPTIEEKVSSASKEMESAEKSSLKAVKRATETQQHTSSITSEDLQNLKLSDSHFRDQSADSKDEKSSHTRNLPQIANENKYFLSSEEISPQEFDLIQPNCSKSQKKETDDAESKNTLANDPFFEEDDPEIAKFLQKNTELDKKLVESLSLVDIRKVNPNSEPTSKDTVKNHKDKPQSKKKGVTLTVDPFHHSKCPYFHRNKEILKDKIVVPSSATVSENASTEQNPDISDHIQNTILLCTVSNQYFTGRFYLSKNTGIPYITLQNQHSKSQLDSTSSTESKNYSLFLSIQFVKNRFTLTYNNKTTVIDNPQIIKVKMVEISDLNKRINLKIHGTLKSQNSKHKSEDKTSWYKVKLDVLKFIEPHKILTEEEQIKKFDQSWSFHSTSEFISPEKFLDAYALNDKITWLDKHRFCFSILEIPIFGWYDGKRVELRGNKKILKMIRGSITNGE